MKLDHLPVVGGERLDVDCLSQNRVEMEDNADYLALIQAQGTRKSAIDLDGRKSLVLPNASTTEAIDSIPTDCRVHDWSARHSCPSHVDGARFSRWLLAIGGRWRLTINELDGDILGGLKTSGHVSTDPISTCNFRHVLSLMSLMLTQGLMAD